MNENGDLYVDVTMKFAEAFQDETGLATAIDSDSDRWVLFCVADHVVGERFVQLIDEMHELLMRFSDVK